LNRAAKVDAPPPRPADRDRQNVRLKRFQFAEIGVVDAHANEVATHVLDGNLPLRLFRAASKAAIIDENIRMLRPRSSVLSFCRRAAGQ
jgi:hypothetical protein